MLFIEHECVTSIYFMFHFLNDILLPACC